MKGKPARLSADLQKKKDAIHFAAEV